VTGEPLLDTGLLVRRHTVEDDVDLVARIGPGEEVEEGEQFDGSVLSRGLSRDDAGGDLECGRQGERGVALVVVGMAFDLPGPEGQHRLRPIERVDLGLLVDRQNDRPRGRAEGEPDHVGPLGYELGIAAEFERLGPMRLEAALPPDPQDRVRAHPPPYWPTDGRSSGWIPPAASGSWPRSARGSPGHRSPADRSSDHRRGRTGRVPECGSATARPSGRRRRVRQRSSPWRPLRTLAG